MKILQLPSIAIVFYLSSMSQSCVFAGTANHKSNVIVETAEMAKAYWFNETSEYLTFDRAAYSLSQTNEAKLKGFVEALKKKPLHRDDRILIFSWSDNKHPHLSADSLSVNDQELARRRGETVEKTIHNLTSSTARPHLKIINMATACSTLEKLATGELEENVKCAFIEGKTRSLEVAKYAKDLASKGKEQRVVLMYIPAIFPL